MIDPPTPTPAIEVRNLCKSYGATQALDDVSLTAAVGELTAIVGENGAGKSTLMKVLSGLERPTSGTVTIFGDHVSTFEPAVLQDRYGVALVPQELSLCNDRSIAQNVLLGMEPGSAWGIRTSALVDKTKGLLEKLGSHLDPRTPVARLDVADQQLVVIARALARNARVLIFDEPTSVLSPVESQALFAVISQLRSDGVTMLYVSHRMPEIFELSDQIHTLRDGVHVASMRTTETNPQIVVNSMVGRELGEQISRSAAEHDHSKGEPKPRLEVRSLTGSRFESVSFRVPAGQIVGIAGLPDSGRTELLRAMFGADRVESGQIQLDGEQFLGRSPADAIRVGMAYLPGERRQQGIFPTMSVAQNISVLALPKARRAGLLSRSKLNHYAQEAIAEFGVKTGTPRQPITSLSGGNQQKALIARWLSIHPRLLLLDDPTRGIDVGAKSEIYALFSELAKSGVSLVMSSSDLPELLTTTDRLLIMSSGRIVGDLATKDATEEYVMELATNATTLKETA